MLSDLSLPLVHSLLFLCVHETKSNTNSVTKGNIKPQNIFQLQNTLKSFQRTLYLTALKFLINVLKCLSSGSVVSVETVSQFQRGFERRRARLAKDAPSFNKLNLYSFLLQHEKTNFSFSNQSRDSPKWKISYPSDALDSSDIRLLL